MDRSENNDITYLSDEPYLLTDSAADDSADGQDDDDDCDRTGVLREQDRFLPIANVARLMKKSIPPSGKIAKDARETVQECVSEFVSFVTSEASDRCHQEKRKTINGEDILFAMSSLGFDNYIEPLKLYLQKYREATKGDKVIIGEGGVEILTASPSPSVPNPIGPATSIVGVGATANTTVGGGGIPTTVTDSEGNSFYIKVVEKTGN